MGNKKRIGYLLQVGFLLGMVFHAYSQEQSVKQLLAKVTDFYTITQEYQVDMTFNMYRGLTGTRITESYTGKMEKSAAYNKNSILGTLVYRFPQAQIIVDEEQKKITYTRLEPETAQNSPLDVGQYLKYYKNSQLREETNQWICELVADQNAFTQISYGKVVLYINKKDYRITKQVLFFSNLIPFKGKDGSQMEQDYGRLQIDLVYDLGKEIKKKQLGDFITRTGNNKIQLQKEFADYQLIDQTQ